MSCHHGLQHSIKFRVQWLQARSVASAARGRNNVPKKTPKLARPPVLKQNASRSGTENLEVSDPPKRLLAETRGNSGVYEFPEKLLVYQPRAGKTAFVAFLKMIGLISFAMGTTYYGIQTVADQEQSNLQVLPVAAICAVPALFITYFSAPYCAGIHIHLPIHARSSMAHLTRYVSNIPASTTITFTTIRFLPWRARSTGTMFSSLRRLPPRIGRIANIKYEPGIDLTRLEGEASLWETIKKRVATGPQEEFFVPLSDLNMKRSRAPGVWQTVWDQVPPA